MGKSPYGWLSLIILLGRSSGYPGGGGGGKSPYGWLSLIILLGRGSRYPGGGGGKRPYGWII